MTDLTKEDNALEQAELDALKAKADQLGVSYHPSISASKLNTKIKAHLEGVKPTDEAADAAPVVTLGQKRKKMKEDALALVRVNITCMNPAKKDWDGEIFAVGNSTLGTVKKFVPFNTEDGYHIPRIMLDMLKERQCQIFTTERAKGGINVRKSKLIKEFGIVELPPLTKEELANLAKIQAAAGVIE